MSNHETITYLHKLAEHDTEQNEKIVALCDCVLELQVAVRALLARLEKLERNAQVVAVQRN